MGLGFRVEGPSHPEQEPPKSRGYIGIMEKEDGNYQYIGVM